VLVGTQYGDLVFPNNNIKRKTDTEREFGEYEQYYNGFEGFHTDILRDNLDKIAFNMSKRNIRKGFNLRRKNK